MSYLNSIAFIKTLKLILKYPVTSLNILTDAAKKQLLKQTATPFPRIITLYVTNKCNLNCLMCLNAKYRNKKISDPEIKIEIVKKIIPELKKYRPMVCITGGEPLLIPNIFKIVSLLSRNKILTSMTTNGYLLEKYARQIADSGLEFLSVSLDHYDGEKHDQGRGVKNTYKKLIRGLDEIVKLRIKTPGNIKINTVIGKNNYRDLSRMYDFVESLGIDEWSIQHHSFINPPARKAINRYIRARHSGNYIVGENIRQDHFFNKKQIQILREQLKDIQGKKSKHRTKLSIKPETNDVFSYYLGKFPSKLSDCIWPFISVNIMEGSKVTLCLGNEIGDLTNENSISQIWHSKQTCSFQEMISKERVLPLCFRCCGLNFHF